MSTSSIQESNGNENDEDNTYDMYVAAQTEALEQDISWPPQDSILRELLPRYTLNGLNIPVVEGRDTLALTRNTDTINSTAVEMASVLPSAEPAVQENLNTMSARIGRRLFWRLPPLPTSYSEPQQSTLPSNNRESRHSTVPFYYDEPDPSVLSFPYGELRLRRNLEQRLPQGIHRRQAYPHQPEDRREQMRQEMSVPLTYSTYFGHQTYHRMPMVPLGSVRGQSEEENQREIERYLEVRNSATQSAMHEGQTTYGALPHGVDHQHLVAPLLQQPSEEEQRTPPNAAQIATPENTPDTSSPYLYRSTAQSTAMTLPDPASQHRATVQPSQPSSDLINSPVPYQYLPRTHVQVEMRVPNPRSQEGQRQNTRQSRIPVQRSSPAQNTQAVTLSNSVPARRYTVSQGDLLLDTSHAHHESEHLSIPTDSSTTEILRRAEVRRMTAAYRLGVEEENFANYATRRNATRGISPPREPIEERRPNTDSRLRTLLDHFHSHAASPTPPPRPLHLTARSAQAGANPDARINLLENQRLDDAILQLALCNALSDSRVVVAHMATAEEREEATTNSRSARRRTRESAREWVPTSRIVTPSERYELRAMVARRDALGRRMGVGAELEECLGEILGRWAFDVWVAQAVMGPRDTDSDSRTRRRVGAVWLGPPVDGGSIVREWHLIPADGDDEDGIGEGWVEWREAGVGMRDGWFVVHDVFR